MKKKNIKKLGALAIGTTLAVSCVLSPIAAAEEVPTETEVTTAFTQQAELKTTILNEILPVEPTTEETTTETTAEPTTTPNEETDKSILFDRYEEVKSAMEPIQPDWMIPESYQALVNALAKAEEVLNDDSATQEEVNSALKDLNDAYDNAQFTEQGLIGLMKWAVGEADKELSNIAFTPESWKVYTDARAVLLELLENPNASVESVYEAFETYSRAILTLEPLDDIDAMRVSAGELLKEAKAAVAKPEKYTKESLAAVKDAIPVLEAALDEEADIAELTEAYDALDKAMGALEAITEEPTTKPTTKPSTGGSDNPKTGDDSNMLPIGLTASVSMAVMGAIVLLKKKKAGENE